MARSDRYYESILSSRAPSSSSSSLTRPNAPGVSCWRRARPAPSRRRRRVRRNLRPHPAGAVFRPIRASAARRDLGLSPPLARGWNTSGHTPGHARPRHPRSPDVPAARAEEPSEPASEPASAPSEPASSAAPRKPGHATRVTEPAPAHAARVEIVLAPRDTRRVPGHTPKHTAGRYPDPRRGIPSRVADRELRVATTPRLPIRRAASTPRRRERARFERASCASSCASSCGGTPNAATCSGVHNSLSSATKRSSRHDDPAAHRLLKSRRARQSIFRWSGRVTSAGGAGRPAARRRSARSGAAMASFAADQN